LDLGLVFQEALNAFEVVYVDASSEEGLTLAWLGQELSTSKRPWGGPRGVAGLGDYPDCKE